MKLLVLHTVPCTVLFPLLVVFLLLWFAQFVILLLPLALSVCIFLFSCVWLRRFAVSILSNRWGRLNRERRPSRFIASDSINEPRRIVHFPHSSCIVEKWASAEKSRWSMGSIRPWLEKVNEVCSFERLILGSRSKL